MIPKPLEDVTASDLLDLVNAKRAERLTLEYKAQLPGNGDDDKREFLYDMASFANASGGDIVYGIEDERDVAGKPTGIPAGISGVSAGNIDAEILRLTSVIRDGIDPRIIGVEARHVSVNGKVVVILRLPKSWAAPHMVVFKGVSRFYTRTSAGKYPMDVHELRAAFNTSSSMPERVRAFRLERLGRILADDVPAPLESGPRLVLHLLPYSALDPLSRTTPSTAEIALGPISGSNWSSRHNFDGFLSNAEAGSGYVQLYRSGAVEAVDTRLLNARSGPREYAHLIPSSLVERGLFEATTRYLTAIEHTGATAPIFILLSFTGMKGREMATRNALWYGSSMIDRDLLLLPEIMLDSFGVVVPTAMRSAIDLLWQASGYKGSPNFDASGTWKPSG
jgi:Putative DNA-binding domain